MRVQAISNELFGEHIDIIEWSSDPAQFIRDALSPARVNRVILDKAHKSALVVVPNNQLRQAVGRGGVNVRLAEQLTGWKLEVRSEEEIARAEKEENRITLCGALRVGAPPPSTPCFASHAIPKRAKWRLTLSNACPDAARTYAPTPNVFGLSASARAWSAC